MGVPAVPEYAMTHMNRNDVVPSFVNVNETAALQDALEQLRKSDYNTDASFDGRFRDQSCGLSQRHEMRNNKEARSVHISAAFVMSTWRLRMAEHDNPATIEDIVALTARFSERKDAVSRLELKHPGEKSMEIGTCWIEALRSPSSTDSTQTASLSHANLQDVYVPRHRLP